jgi:DNA polymerase III epsilon subunit-like protein
MIIDPEYRKHQYNYGKKIAREEDNPLEAKYQVGEFVYYHGSILKQHGFYTVWLITRDDNMWKYNIGRGDGFINRVWEISLSKTAEEGDEKYRKFQDNIKKMIDDNKPQQRIRWYNKGKLEENVNQGKKIKIIYLWQLFEKYKHHINKAEFVRDELKKDAVGNYVKLKFYLSDKRENIYTMFDRWLLLEDVYVQNIEDFQALFVLLKGMGGIIANEDLVLEVKERIYSEEDPYGEEDWEVNENKKYRPRYGWKFNKEGFKKGDTIICLKKRDDFVDFGLGLMNVIPNYVTVGKKYKIDGFESGFVKIKDDTGKVNAYCLTDFTKSEKKYKDYIKKRDKMKHVDPYGEEDWEINESNNKFLNKFVKLQDVYDRHTNKEGFLNELKSRFLGKDVCVVEQYKVDGWQEVPNGWGRMKISSIDWISDKVPYDIYKKSYKTRYIITLNFRLNLNLQDAIRVVKKITSKEDPYGEEDWEEFELNESVKNYDFLQKKAIMYNNREEMIKVVMKLHELGQLTYKSLEKYERSKKLLRFFYFYPTDRAFVRSENEQILKYFGLEPMSFDEFMKLGNVKYKRIESDTTVDPYDEEEWGWDIIKESLNANNKIIIHDIKTQEMYSELMKYLEILGATWGTGKLPTENNFYGKYNDLAICIKDNELGYAYTQYFRSVKDYNDYEFIKAEEILKYKKFKKIEGNPEVDPYGEEEWGWEEEDEENKMMKEFKTFSARNKVFEHKLHRNQIQFLDYIKNLSDDSTFVFIDTETTGIGGFRKQQLTQISSIASIYHFGINNFDEIDNFNEKIKLTRETITSRSKEELVKILKFNRYGERGVDYIDEQESLKNFLSWIENFQNPLWLIQNASFDMNMLCGRSGIKIKYPVLDIKQIIQLFVIPIVEKLAETDAEMKNKLEKIGKSDRDKGLWNSSMSKWAPFFGISLEGYHNALDDCRITMQMYMKVIDFIKENKDLNIQHYQMNRIKLK